MTVYEDTGSVPVCVKILQPSALDNIFEVEDYLVNVMARSTGIAVNLLLYIHIDAGLVLHGWPSSYVINCGYFFISANIARRCQIANSNTIARYQNVLRLQ